MNTTLQKLSIARLINLNKLVSNVCKNSSFKRHNSNCWSCGRQLSPADVKSFFCPCDLKHILPVNEKLNYFELFNLKYDYKIDQTELTKNFRQLMRKLHPDLYTQKSDREKQYSADQSSLVNKAYRVLSSAIGRGLYILELEKIDYERESVTVNESESDRTNILMHVLQLNEIIDEIEKPNEVEQLEAKLKEIIKPLEKEVENAFAHKNFTQMVELISKMKYYKNIDERLKDLKLKFNLVNDE